MGASCEGKYHGALLLRVRESAHGNRLFYFYKLALSEPQALMT